MWTRRIAAAGMFLVGVVFDPAGVGAQSPINPTERLRTELNGNVKARQVVVNTHSIAATLDRDAANWLVTEVVVPALNAVEMKYELPKMKYVRVGGSVTANCTRDPKSDSVGLAGKWSDGVTLRKSQTMTTGASMTFEGGFGPFSKVGLTAKMDSAFTEGKDTTSSEERSTSRTHNLTTRPYSGVYSILYIGVIEGKSIPWSVTFAPSDGSSVSIAFVHKGRGQVCFTHRGQEKCLSAYDSAQVEANPLKMKITGPLHVQVDDGAGLDTYTVGPGATSGWTRSVKSVVKTSPPIGRLSMQWGMLKEALPESARKVTLSGTMDYKKGVADETLIRDHDMDQDQYNAQCLTPEDSGPSLRALKSEKPRGDGMPGAKAKVIHRKLSPAELNALKLPAP